VQITRQRVRPEMTIETLEKCPSCDGTGKIKASIIITDEIENNIRYLVQEQNEKQVTIEVHPFLHAYLTKGILTSMRSKWQRKFGKKVAINKNSSFHFLEYHIYDKNGEELKI
jgi:ribonuclease G